LQRFTGARGLEQGVSQPHRIPPPNLKRLLKYTSFVAALRMQWVKAIVFKLSNVDG